MSTSFTLEQTLEQVIGRNLTNKFRVRLRRRREQVSLRSTDPEPQTLS